MNHDKQWHEVVRSDEIPPESCKELEFQGRLIVIYNVAGVLYAVDGACPHQGASLAEGQREGCVVTCPWHSWQFDIERGCNIYNSDIKLQRYPIKLESGMILLALP